MTQMKMTNYEDGDEDRDDNIKNYVKDDNNAASVLSLSLSRNDPFQLLHDLTDI